MSSILNDNKKLSHQFLKLKYEQALIKKHLKLFVAKLIKTRNEDCQK